MEDEKEIGGREGARGGRGRGGRRKMRLPDCRGTGGCTTELALMGKRGCGWKS